MENGNDWNESDMALELAEWHFLNLQITELLARAEKSLQQEWLEKAATHPDAVREAYNQLIGDIGK